MDNKPIIAVDIDEVLTPHFQDLIDWYNKQYGTRLTLANNHPKTPEGWGTESIEEAVKRVQEFFDTEQFRQSEPFNEAKNAAKQLSQKYDLVIITARDTIVEKITRDWISKHFPELFSDVHFAAMYSLDNRAKPKSEIAKMIGVDYLIDDSLEHITSSAAEGIKGLLFGEYPWNQVGELPEGVTRVKDWPEILEYFDGQAQ
ncbi:MAG TPA: hypothetical protein VLF88_00290 [Candidatus Babeliales bacterium]|nr:hypothetical protein [Candidatus Babeliales bacterium]